MSTLSRTLIPLALIGLIAGCTGGPSTTSAGDESPGTSSPPASADADAIEHATGATDIVLRYEEGAGFMMPTFIATIAPIFTLYGDGTVIFRNPLDEAPPAQGPIMRNNPFRTAQMSEDQIQELLEFALGDGGLAVARPVYENPMISDAGTAIFTVTAGGVEKTVSVYALGLDGEGVPDLPARAAFLKLAERLTNIDNDGAFPTDVYVPTAYRAILIDDGGFPGPQPMNWPFGELTPADFVADPTNPTMQFPSRVMSTEEVAALGLTDFEGGLMGITILGPGDGKSYSFALRPLLPDESS